MSDPAILTGATATDRSVVFLNDIFGVGWQNSITAAPSGDFANVLFTIFSAFNAVILACVMALMFYVISSGIMGTAHEGEALGKRYSTLYTPIRGAFAVSLLMPLPWVKMSMMQALILKFIFFSISGASYIANQAVTQIAAQGGVASPTVNFPQANGLGEQILKNLVIQQYFKIQQGIDVSTPGYIIDSSDKSSIKINFSSPNNDNTVMGGIAIDCHSFAQDVCTGEQSAVENLINALGPLAMDLGSDYTGDATGGNKNINTMLTDFNKATSSYVTASQINSAKSKDIINSLATKQLNGMVDDINKNGWAWLGTYYIRMSRASDVAHKTLNTHA